MSAVASEEQLAALYESGMSVEELSQAFGYEPTAIKVTLERTSKLFRERVADSSEVFSKDEYDTARQVLARLMVTSDSDQVKFRAAKLVMFEKLGRNDQKGLRSVNLNINVLNQHIREVEEAEKRALTKTVEVDPRHAHLKAIDV